MKKKYDYFESGITYIILAFFAVIALFPLVWMLSTSIKNPTELFDMPPEIIPDIPTFTNYINVLTTSKMYTAFANSVFITFCVVCITVLVSALASYGLVFYKLKGRDAFQMSMLFGQMIPGVVIVIPLYAVFAKMGLLDTKLSLIIADLALTIPMGIVTLTSFFKTVPKELIEAANIDGDTGIGALFHIVLPVVKPGLISVTIYTFIHSWEEFLFALRFSNTSNSITLPIAINSFAGEFSVDWGATMAAATVVALPVLAIFLLCNKYFVKGLSDGAVKG